MNGCVGRVGFFSNFFFRVLLERFHLSSSLSVDYRPIDMAEAAVAEKNLGNEAYKKKDFATAHVHYDKAIELDPANATFHSNKAAAFFEEAKFDECIASCEKAVEIGREHRADYTVIAKALARAGNAELKRGNLKPALNWFQRSLSEYRDPELVKKAKALENQIKEEELKSYINPELAEQEKQKGNELFKYFYNRLPFQKGDFPGAMKHYNEAVKRHPDNAILYSNRAACLTKLMDFQRALDDCEKCIRIDPNFIKAYIRKGAVLTAMKEWGKAQSTYEAALHIDPNNAEAREGVRLCMSNNDEKPEQARERALADPEIQEILRDPGMRLILEQMSNDPGALREHLTNPEIAKKIMKLKEAGIVQIR
ncbi:sti-1 [Pristionchus pacificus]|uniref:Stress-induced-phosphoprotein 1 n=1 Tax=Pristionchus pacificus TaxID=54126 RepID=A0A2A6CGM8_PRIPA|nr:sti-1 [Pristionchus pacificus]|eukprot:PDM77240.1 sti-1 [Pristionchus pacificus]